MVVSECPGCYRVVAYEILRDYFFLHSISGADQFSYETVKHCTDYRPMKCKTSLSSFFGDYMTSLQHVAMC